MIDDSTDLACLLEELKAALPLAVAEIEKYVKDEDLRDYLLKGGGTGLTRYHSLLCLSVLVSRYGPQEKLESVLGQLRAQGITDILRQNIEAHISKLQQDSNN